MLYIIVIFLWVQHSVECHKRERERERERGKKETCKGEIFYLMYKFFYAKRFIYTDIMQIYMISIGIFLFCIQYVYKFCLLSKKKNYSIHKIIKNWNSLRIPSIINYRQVSIFLHIFFSTLETKSCRISLFICSYIILD